MALTLKFTSANQNALPRTRSVWPGLYAFVELTGGRRVQNDDNDGNNSSSMHGFLEKPLCRDETAQTCTQTQINKTKIILAVTRMIRNEFAPNNGQTDQSLSFITLVMKTAALEKIHQLTTTSLQRYDTPWIFFFKLHNDRSQTSSLDITLMSIFVGAFAHVLCCTN